MTQPVAPLLRPPRPRRWPWILLGAAVCAPFVVGALWYVAILIALRGPSPSGEDQERLEALEADAVLDVDPEGAWAGWSSGTAGSCCGLWNSSTDTAASEHWDLDRDDHLDALRAYARAAVDDGWVVEVPPANGRAFHTCGRIEGQKDFGEWSAGLLVELRDAYRGDLHVTLSTRAVDAGGTTPEVAGPGRYVDVGSGAVLDADAALARLCLDTPAMPPPSTTSPS